MGLRAEDVKNIRSIAFCKDILRHAIELNDQLNEELRHQKYKRCLAMAFCCESLIRKAFLANPEYVEWLYKWREKWLKISEKIKEAKCR